MSNFLAIDTSSRHLTVLAVKGEEQCLKFIPDCALNHSVILMDEVDKALKSIKLLPYECDFFAAVTGPGSFTGIRIGIATSKGFAVATHRPLVSVTAFNLLAYNVEDSNFYVVIDAAHSHYYVCGYGEGRKITLEPCYLEKSEVEKLGKLYGFEQLDFENYTKLDVSRCLYTAAVALKGEASDKMQALYVRKSQAEEGRK